MKKQLCAVVAAGAFLLGGALPAQADAGVQKTVNDENSAGALGFGLLDGSVIAISPGRTVTTGTYPYGKSVRSVHTGRGWCISEIGWQSTYDSAQNKHVSRYVDKVHRYTTKNGGYSQTTAATIKQARSDVTDTTSVFKLYRCT